MRTSLREDHLSYNREAGVYQHCEMEILQERFSSSSDPPCPTTSTVHNPTTQPDHHGVLELRETAKERVNISVNGVEKTALKTTQVVILNKPTPDNCPDSVASWGDGVECEPSTSHPGDGVVSTAMSEDHSSDSLTRTQHRTRLMISNSDLGNENLHDTQKSSKLRAKSFTGMVSPRSLADQDPPLTQPEENLANAKQEKKATSSFKIAEEDEKLLRSVTMSRRAKLLREGGATRYSSDLGFGARPKSKREVFV